MLPDLRKWVRFVNLAPLGLACARRMICGRCPNRVLANPAVRCGPNRVCLPPQREGRGQGLDARLLPPRCFVTLPVNFAMMQPTNRHRELIAHLASKRRGLGKAQVMRVGGCAAAHQAWLARDEGAVLLVAQADDLCLQAGSPGSRSVAMGSDAIWFTSSSITFRGSKAITISKWAFRCSGA